MGKTRDLFKKIRDTKGAFHAKMGTIKDRNGMDLTDAEDLIQFLGWKDPLEKESATHSSILAWKIIPCTEEPGRLQSMGSQKSWTQLSN